jgi:threonine dehydrogenase-like Zn-dependent dehydrogenase
VQALVFEQSIPRLALTKLLGFVSPRAFVARTAPIQLREIPEPQLPAPDWLRIRTRLCGLCGSDYKQVFLNGATDNPMTAVISFPQVLGHEVVGVVDSVGAGVSARRVGERVVLNPWLSCAPRGLDPCRWCASGDLAQCANFTRGTLQPGIHTGNSSDATGGFATLVPAHESMCFPIPDDVSFEEAVLADPFSVSLHAVLRNPPPRDGTALIYGCGTLGLLSIPILRILHPNVRVLAIARFPHQADLARRMGAHVVLAHRPTRKIISQIAEATGADEHVPWRGLPMLNGGVDIVYDSVGLPETLEVGVRVTRSRGCIVVTGVETPHRFEWTPLYFKEIALVGSNAFGIEEIDGVRMHAMEWYFEFIRSRGFDGTPILTQRYALLDWQRAFLDCHDQGQSGAVKVLFDLS